MKGTGRGWRCVFVGDCAPIVVRFRQTSLVRTDFANTGHREAGEVELLTSWGVHLNSSFEVQQYCRFSKVVGYGGAVQNLEHSQQLVQELMLKPEEVNRIHWQSRRAYRFFVALALFPGYFLALETPSGTVALPFAT